MQYGAFVVPLAGALQVVPFPAPFTAIPTSVTFSIETAAPVMAVMPPGSLLAASFTVLASAPLMAGDVIRWVAIL